MGSESSRWRRLCHVSANSWVRLTANDDRIVDVLNIRRGGGGNAHPAEKVLGWRDETSVFERLESYAPRDFDLTDGSQEPARISALAASVGLFDMLGVRPFLGRAFVAADAVPGTDRLVIVNARLAERRLGGPQRALGATITPPDWTPPPRKRGRTRSLAGHRRKPCCVRHGIFGLTKNGWPPRSWWRLRVWLPHGGPQGARCAWTRRWPFGPSRAGLLRASTAR